MHVHSLGRPMLADAGDTEVFALCDDTLIRMELTAGRVTITRIESPPSSGPMSLLVGTDQVLIHPYDFIPGVLVRDNQPPDAAPKELPQGGAALPGPAPDLFWFEKRTERKSSIVLRDLLGNAPQASARLPSANTWLSADGTGQVLVSGVGGVYRTTASGFVRVTRGTVVATGPEHLLLHDCNQHFRCRTELVNRDSGKKRRFREVRGSGGCRVEL